MAQRRIKYYKTAKDVQERRKIEMEEDPDPMIVAEASPPPYGKTGLSVFKTSRAGGQKEYKIRSSFGYFIEPFRKATNIHQISDVVERGVSSKEIEPVIQYLNLKVPEIAKAAAVSTSTVSRWEPESSIGVAGSNQFFKIDEVIKKGIDLFGGEEEFKNWLNSPNLALGNQIPAKMTTSPIGIELVDEALDALHFGTVL